MGGFETTNWSLILESRSEDAPAALESLCRRYRAPVLAFVRHRGLAADSCEDLTQGFFVHLLAQRLPQQADPSRGRFRNYLLTALKHYLASEVRREHADKRGGGLAALALEDAPELAGSDDPEHAFERAWARTVLTAALERLHRETRAAGRENLFHALREFLFEVPQADDYAQVAQRLGMSRNTVAVAVHRLRQRLHELVRAEVADTVLDPAALDEELTTLPSLARPTLLA